MRLQSLILSAIVLALMIAAIVTALDFAAEARRAPLVVAVPTAVLLAAQVIRDAVALVRHDPERQSKGGLDENASYAAEADEDAEEDAAEGTERAAAQAEGTTVIRGFAWIFLLVGMFLLLGMLVTVPLFVAAFAWGYGRERLHTVLLSAAITFGVAYFGFVRVLELQLYPGVIWGLFD